MGRIIEELACLHMQPSGGDQMVPGHSTDEWELGCSDPRQNILCTIVGVTTDGDG